MRPTLLLVMGSRTTREARMRGNGGKETKFSAKGFRQKGFHFADASGKMRGRLSAQQWDLCAGLLVEKGRKKPDGGECQLSKPANEMMSKSVRPPSVSPDP